MRAPVLILAGGRDSIIPPRFSRKLTDALPGVKRYVGYPAGHHVDLLHRGGIDEVAAWFGPRSVHSGAMQQ